MEHDNYFRPTNANDLPPNARKVPVAEVMKIQWAILNKEPIGTSWPFTCGTTILTASAALTSIVLVASYRRRFRLGGVGLAMTYFPGTAVTIGFTFLGTKLLVASETLIGRFEGCLNCAQMRALGVQLVGGLIYPFCAAPIACIAACKINSVMELPPLYPWSQFKTNLPKLIRPVYPIMIASAVLQTALVLYITKKQQEKFKKMMMEGPLYRFS